MFCLKKYRHYVVNLSKKNSDWEHITLDAAVWVKEYLSQRSIRYKSIFSYINHPLVNSGEAFWIDDTILCLGYKLKNNKSIFRPIFSYKRQNLIDNFQKDISKIVLKREKCMNYNELFKVKKMPKDILDYIFEFY